MGVLNVTPDSFSDGGQWVSAEASISRALEMVAQGADIIDIGGESSRPGADPVSPEEEQRRVLPVLKGLRRQSDIPISIDTCKASVARAALDVGADVINDISALRSDSEMPDLLQKTQAAVVLMHMQGVPMSMQDKPHYTDCVLEVASFFTERLSWCDTVGIDRSRLIIDPGIGFGKRLQDNLDLLRKLSYFKRFNLPLLVGASRKSFIAMVSGSERPAGERLGGSIAAALMAVMHGADIVRVHDVAETAEALAITRAVRESK